MQSNRPFQTYNGGKNGSGVYQAIINQIPPHDYFISAFAGNCGVLANKKRASLANIAIDVDASVIKGWRNIGGINTLQRDGIEYLESENLSSKNIFIFLDPPYLMETRSSKGNLYKYEMKDPATHERMLAAANKLKCNCLIIHYPNDLYDTRLGNWRTKDIQGRTRNGMRTEKMYMNYPEPTELHDYSFIGEDFRERELYKKMKNNMISKFNRMSPLERNFILDALKIDSGTHRIKINSGHI